MDSLIQKYQESVKEHKKWENSDDILYKLCKKHPSHGKNEEQWVRAKVLFIGRAYATGIERHTKKKKGEPGALIKLIKFLTDYCGRIDNEFEKIKQAGAKEDCQGTLKQAVESHGKLMNLYIKKVSGVTHSTRSFWSKYLHFHSKFVPLYDSKASKNLSALFRKNEKLKKTFFKNPPEKFKNSIGDKIYLEFLKKFYVLASKGLNFNDEMIKKKIKDIDYFLLTFMK